MSKSAVVGSGTDAPTKVGAGFSKPTESTMPSTAVKKPGVTTAHGCEGSHWS
jgi:hypothetical protein